MSGYETYTRYQRIEAQAKLLGFRLGRSKTVGSWERTDTDTVTVYPDQDRLPIYSRDAEIFTGTFGQLEVFLQGWAKAQQYDMMLRMTDDKKRKKYEAKELERQRLTQERIERRKTFAILSDKTETEVDRLVR